jgi:hypothetical protein
VLARVGLIAYGVVHLLIGWLALHKAWGGWASKSADLSGALRTLAEQPFGKILLWLVAVGLMALALWQASEAIWGYRKHEGKRRWGMALQQDSYLAMRIETRSNGVAVVTLNRPERLNAVNGTLHHELARFTRDAEADPDVRVVVLAGAGRASFGMR